MTPHKDGLPALPEQGYLGDDASYGHDDCAMLEYGRACFEAGKLAALPLPVQGDAVTFDDFDDAITADAIRALGIKTPTLRQVTELQKAMAAALPKAQPASPERNPLTDEQWYDLASRHANADWNCAQPDGYLNAVKALALDFAATQEPRT